MCLVQWVLVATFWIALTHADGVRPGGVDSQLFHLFFRNNAANGANNHPASGVFFPASPVGPDRSSGTNKQLHGSDNCNDHHHHCQQWEQQGECRNNIDYMAPHCKRSCGYCDKLAPGCNDKNDYCVAWGVRGECLTHPDYMKINCAAACKACGTTSIAASLRRDETKPPSIQGIEIRPPSPPSK